MESPGAAAFEFLDAGIGVAQRFVLDQRRLHQRVERMRRARQPFRDQRFGLRIALVSFKTCEPIEQIGDKLAFLRCHRCPPVKTANMW